MQMTKQRNKIQWLEAELDKFKARHKVEAVIMVLNCLPKQFASCCGVFSNTCILSDEVMCTL